MNQKDKILITRFIALAIVVGIIIYWLTYEKDKALVMLEKRNNENDLLKEKNSILQNYNQLTTNKLNEYKKKHLEIKRIISNEKNIESVIKEKLTHLINTYGDFDIPVSSELTAAAALISAKQPTKAAFSLAKIVENLLKEKYSKTNDFEDFIKSSNNGKKRKPVFNDYIEFAKSQKDINNEEYHYAKALKEIRNQEGHELNVEKTENIISSAILTGIELICRIGNYFKPHLTEKQNILNEQNI